MQQSPIVLKNMAPKVIDLTEEEDEDNSLDREPPEKRLKLSTENGNSRPKQLEQVTSSLCPALSCYMQDIKPDIRQVASKMSSTEFANNHTSITGNGHYQNGSDSNNNNNVLETQSLERQHSSQTSQAPNRQAISDDRFSRTRSKKNGFNQFWKAGDYEIPSTQQSNIKGGMDHLRVHPKFLHSNATSHKWAFGAIAELLDNAVDEIRNGATFVKVDHMLVHPDKSHALLFHDDGGGMDPECIRQCMSLGYSMKKTKTTIGQYGNGFKTSTMRLGADAIVFTRTARGSSSTQSIGLLSYTFLRMTGQDDIIVPMLDFELSSDQRQPKMLIEGSEEIWNKNLSIMMKWSPFKSESDLLKQFDDIGAHGTKIIIYNLWHNDDGILELDFDTDKEDIKLRGNTKEGLTRHLAQDLLWSHISIRLRHSLRDYASILYLNKMPNFQIVLRGKPVIHYNVCDDLKFSKVITYKPQLGTGVKEVVVTTNIGFTKEAPLINVHGFNVYHKNRLIMPFWKVWQDNSSRGRGVIGVLEANFIEPAHDKQDFERTSAFNRLESKLKQITLDYWKDNCCYIGYQGGSKQGAETPRKAARPVQKAVQNPRPLSSMGPQVLHQQASPNQEMSESDRAEDSLAAQSMATTSTDTQLSNTALKIISDKLLEENVQLFMRCEFRRLKEIELSEKAVTLENDLRNAKLKYEQLVASVEKFKRRQDKS